jgi:hypothetical protein
MDPDDNGNGAPPNDGSGATDDDNVLEQLAPAIREAIDRKIAAVKAGEWAQARRTFQGRAQKQAARGGNTGDAGASNHAPAAPFDSMAAINALVQLKVAEAFGAMGNAGQARPLGPPVTGGATVAPSDPIRSDTPIHKLSIPDREVLLSRIGPIEFKNRLFRESASVLVKGIRR